jgi:hypothetical protein
MPQAIFPCRERRRAPDPAGQSQNEASTEKPMPARMRNEIVNR